MARARRATSPAAALAEVVIIGGGFAGLQVARQLMDAPVRVTIVDRHNFHTFLPLLYQVATAGLEPADVAYPIRTIFGRSSNVSFRHGHAASIDFESKVVHLEGGGQLRFDHLVLASGGTANFFGVEGAANFALPLYTLAHARALRNRLLLSLEAADVAGVSAPTAVTVVVVGGGPTGVEVAGAVVELLEICQRRDGLRIDPERSKVVLVDVAPRLLTAFPESASAYAARGLERRGVELRLGTAVIEVHDGGVRLEGGAELDAIAVIWAAGITATGTLADAAGASGPGGRVSVAPDLSVPGHQGVWAVGDAAAVYDAATDSICPQLAPVAIQSGRHCAEQIIRQLGGQPTQPFRYRNKGIMATIGRHAAVAKLPSGPVVRGTLGWLAWLSLHLFYLVGFRNQVRVLTNWTWRYFDWPSGPRLIVADAETAD